MLTKKKGEFAAVEVKPDETAHQAIGVLMRCAHAQGILFGYLELYDTFKINRTSFVRFKSDLPLPKVNLDGRAVVQRAREAYEVILASGVKAPYPFSSMHGTPRMTEFKVYRGTGAPFWERQFA